MKRVLIVGAGSYVGGSIKEYLGQYADEYEADILDARGLMPAERHFRGYDVVFYVAGIAHVKETKKNAHLYYEVNRDLAVSVAGAAKTAGVRHFIIMSTMAVYGLTEGVIEKGTKPVPKTHYGRSKLEADRIIWKMHDENFHVTVMRPPMIYGRDCKGNYQKLRWIALHMPVFPKVNNQRSMLFIGNLNVFVKEVINDGRQGLFFPQNGSYVNISEMVSLTALANGRKVKLMGIFNPFIGFLKDSPWKAIGKAFGNLTYEKTDCVNEYGFIDTVSLTESKII